MTTLITITEMASMPGRFCCSHKKLPIGKTYSTTHAGSDPEGAAAYAMSIALGCSGAYLVMGPGKVLKCIPPALRSRAE